MVSAVAVGAVWQLDAVRRRQHAETLRTELQRLAVSQESYFYDHGVYAPDLEALAPRGYRPAPEAQVVIREATAAGWSATAVHRVLPVECALYVREAAPVGVAARVGVIGCD